MTGETGDPTEIMTGPEPARASSHSAQPGPAGEVSPRDQGPWVAGPPPLPPGQDPAVPVRDAPPGSPPGPGRGPRRWSIGAGRLAREPVWVLAVASILVAYGAVWLEAVLNALRHQPGLTAQGRILELLNPGSIGWAAIILLGAAIHSVGRRVLGPGHPRTTEAAGTGLFAAAASVAVAGGLGILVELANFGHGVDAAFTGIVGRLGAVALAAAAAWWAWRERVGTTPG